MSDPIRVSIREIAFNDPRLIPNTFRKKASDPGVRVGVSVDGECVRLVPHLCNKTFAFVSLEGKELCKFLTLVPLFTLTEANSNDSELPFVAQRLPTPDRRRKIIQAWGDPILTPDNYDESISLCLFHATIEQGAIRLNRDSIMVVIDGAGRISAAMDELSSESSVVMDRGIVFNVTIDLSGDPHRTCQKFLKHNRDAKKVSRSTTMLVENAQLSLQDDMPTDFSHQLSMIWVERRLYSEYKLEGSVLSLFPWSMEGRKSTSSEFVGKGQAQSLDTALKEKTIRATIERTMSVTMFPYVLDFIFRQFCRLSPEAYMDARRQVTDKNYMGMSRLHTTMALKVMILLGTRIFYAGGKTPREFESLLNQVLWSHYAHHVEDYSNKQFKQMSADKFWMNTSWFTSKQFNSGAMNTQRVLGHLATCCNDILGPLPGLEDGEG